MDRLLKVFRHLSSNRWQKKQRGGGISGAYTWTLSVPQSHATLFTAPRGRVSSLFPKYTAHEKLSTPRKGFLFKILDHILARLGHFWSLVPGLVTRLRNCFCYAAQSLPRMVLNSFASPGIAVMTPRFSPVLLRLRRVPLLSFGSRPGKGIHALRPHEQGHGTASCGCLGQSNLLPSPGTVSLRRECGRKLGFVSEHRNRPSSKLTVIRLLWRCRLSTPRSQFQRTLVRGASVEWLAVRDDYVLEGKVKQGAERWQGSLLMTGRRPDPQFSPGRG